MGWLRWHAGELLVEVVLIVAATRAPWCGVAAVLAAVWMGAQEIRVRRRVGP